MTDSRALLDWVSPLGQKYKEITEEVYRRYVDPETNFLSKDGNDFVQIFFRGTLDDKIIELLDRAKAVFPDPTQVDGHEFLYTMAVTIFYVGGDQLRKSLETYRRASSFHLATLPIMGARYVLHEGLRTNLIEQNGKYLNLNPCRTERYG